MPDASMQAALDLGRLLHALDCKQAQPGFRLLIAMRASEPLPAALLRRGRVVAWETAEAPTAATPGATAPTDCAAEATHGKCGISPTVTEEICCDVLLCALSNTGAVA